MPLLVKKSPSSEESMDSENIRGKKGPTLKPVDGLMTKEGWEILKQDQRLPLAEWETLQLFPGQPTQQRIAVKSKFSQEKD